MHFGYNVVYCNLFMWCGMVYEKILVVLILEGPIYFGTSLGNC